MHRKDPAGAVSIRDVAHLAGVSASTVSRVLNQRPSNIAISPTTIERVRHAATTLRYRPNASARSLRTTKTQTIGVIVHDLLHPFAADLLRVIYAACQSRGYHLLVGHAEHSEREGVVLGDILHADRVDGLLLIGDVLQDAEDDAEMQMVLQMHRHVVSIGCRPHAALELAIAVDNAAGVEMALQYLVELGHRVIAYIGASSEREGCDSWEVALRHRAYRRFMTSHGLPWTPDLELAAPKDLAAAQGAMLRLLALPARPTAALVVNDWTAIVTLKAALTCGIRVPGDLSLIGFDDIAFSALCSPGLTTIHQPLDVMGRHAADVLLDRIEGVQTAHPPAARGAEGAPTTVFAPALIRRESCAPPTAHSAQPMPG